MNADLEAKIAENKRILYWYIDKIIEKDGGSNAEYETSILTTCANRLYCGGPTALNFYATREREQRAAAAMREYVAQQESAKAKAKKKRRA